MNTTILYTVLLLVASNVFMTVAWYGHLKFQDKAFWLRILVSWCIALPEYALQVPANATGIRVMTPTQLKITQEVVTLAVFVVFAWVYFGDTPTWRTLGAFVLVAAAVALVAGGKGEPKEHASALGRVPPEQAQRPPHAGG